jgi:hypothetical protein
MIADLARRTGHFKLMQGAMNPCVAIGAALSSRGVRRQASRLSRRLYGADGNGGRSFTVLLDGDARDQTPDWKVRVWPFLIDAGKRLASQIGG